MATATERPATERRTDEMTVRLDDLPHLIVALQFLREMDRAGTLAFPLDGDEVNGSRLTVKRAGGNVIITYEPTLNSYPWLPRR